MKPKIQHEKTLIMEFADRVLSQMSILGLTQTELAEKIGRRDSTLNGVLKNGAEPRLGLILDIADGLGVSTDYLIRGETRFPSCQEIMPETEPHWRAVLVPPVGLVHAGSGPTVGAAIKAALVDAGVKSLKIIETE